MRSIAPIVTLVIVWALGFGSLVACKRFEVLDQAGLNNLTAFTAIVVALSTWMCVNMIATVIHPPGGAPEPEDDEDHTVPNE